MMQQTLAANLFHIISYSYSCYATRHDATLIINLYFFCTLLKYNIEAIVVIVRIMWFVEVYVNSISSTLSSVTHHLSVFFIHPSSVVCLLWCTVCLLSYLVHVTAPTSFIVVLTCRIIHPLVSYRRTVEAFLDFLAGQWVSCCSLVFGKYAGNWFFFRNFGILTATGI